MIVNLGFWPVTVTFDRNWRQGTWQDRWRTNGQWRDLVYCLVAAREVSGRKIFCQGCQDNTMRVIREKCIHLLL